MTIVFRGDVERGRVWEQYFRTHAPDMPFILWPHVGPPEEVTYLVTWQAPENIVALFPRLQVLFSSGAGVDQFDFDRIPSDVQVVRMIEPGIINGMVEYATLAALMHHRNFIDYDVLRRRREWSPIRVVPAQERHIGVMGIGVLGRAVLERLRSFGFALRAWNRSSRELDGVTCFAGNDELEPFLDGCDILVCLLPLTQTTRGILCRKTFFALKRGAAVINVGRGGHLVDQDLLDALAEGQLSAAILDVTAVEPLPSDHPFWDHPRIVLTPHVASMTQPHTAAQALLANIRRHQTGEELIGAIDRERGY